MGNSLSWDVLPEPTAIARGGPFDGFMWAAKSDCHHLRIVRRDETSEVYRATGRQDEEHPELARFDFDSGALKLDGAPDDTRSG